MRGLQPDGGRLELTEISVARRQELGVFSGLALQAATLPWWAALVLALLSYFGCHAAAGMTVAASEQPTAGVYIKTLASALQYLLPLLFVLAAGLSVYGRQLQAKRLASEQAANEPSKLRSAPRPPAKRSSGTSTYMACPKCGAMMVQRAHEQGPDAGKPYWGCSRAPLCKETLSL